MTIDDLTAQYADDLSFDALIIWADILHIDHDEKQWLDDMWPDKESELRTVVAEAMANLGRAK